MAKQIKFSQEAMERISKGIDLFAKTVGVTLGPKGRYVIYDKIQATPTVTKDGVTVAKEIEFDDRFAELGCALIREVASKTSDIVGDGTTTAIILAQDIFQGGRKLVAAGHNPREIKLGIDQAVSNVIEHLEKHRKVVKKPSEIAQIATISSNDDKEIGSIIAEAIDQIGQDGVITVEESQSINTYLKIIEGVKINSGYMSHQFLRDGEVKVELENPYVFVSDMNISSLHQMETVLNQVAETDRPIFILAGNVVKEALQTLLFNHRKTIITACAVKAPGIGDKKVSIVEDISVLTGARFITDQLGMSLKEVTLDDLGEADKIIVTRKDTLILGGKGDLEEVEARIHRVKSEIQTSWSEFDVERLQDRLGRLVGGIGVIYVGAVTESELKEKKARVEDALNATQAAVNSGVLPGGGAALFRAKEAVRANGNPGMSLIEKALEIPLRKIAENAGMDGSMVVMELMKNDSYSWGYNAQTDKFEDLYESGIVDPTDVVILSLQNASSIAGMLLTTEAAVVSSRSED